ncbi:MAG: restriction endonuclease subunit S [Candidatus Omnitrophota bacterium]
MLDTRKGTFGISAVIGGDTSYIISSEIMRLRLKEKVNPFYFSIINNTSVVQEQYRQKAVGAIMGSLSQEVLKTVKIPVPPLPIQQKIVNEIQERRKRAMRLKEEARSILEAAKKKVEGTMFGDSQVVVEE